MEKNNLIWIFGILLLLIPIASATDIYKQYSNADLKYVCIYNGTACPATTLCNVTVIDPDSNVIVNNKMMTHQVAYWNYTGNFSTIGTYTSIVFCLDALGNDHATDNFQITWNGKPPQTDYMVIFVMFLFLAVVAGIIYLIVYSFEEFGKLKFDLKDLIYNIIAYIALQAIYWFNVNYFGVIILNNILLAFIVTGVFSNIAIPVALFAICYFKNLLEMKRQVKF